MTSRFFSLCLSMFVTNRERERKILIYWRGSKDESSMRLRHFFWFYLKMLTFYFLIERMNNIREDWWRERILLKVNRRGEKIRVSLIKLSGFRRGLSLIETSSIQAERKSRCHRLRVSDRTHLMRVAWIHHHCILSWLLRVDGPMRTRWKLEKIDHEATFGRVKWRIVSYCPLRGNWMELKDPRTESKMLISAFLANGDDAPNPHCWLYILNRGFLSNPEKRV